MCQMISENLYKSKGGKLDCNNCRETTLTKASKILNRLLANRFKHVVNISKISRHSIRKENCKHGI